MYRLSLLLAVLITMSCGNQQSTGKPEASADRQRQQIEKLSDELVASINDFEFYVINNSWSHPAFKARIAQITRVQQSVLAHLFEELTTDIKMSNLSIVHEINDYHGKVSQVSLNFFEGYAELVLLKNFAEQFSFFKYRIEMVEGQPVLSDYFDFAESIWYSEKVRDMLELNADYDAFSVERHHANVAMHASSSALESGDTLSALGYLYDMPETHQAGINISISKIRLAFALTDSIYAEVLNREHERQKSLYFQYLYHYYYADTAQLEEVYQTLESRLGNSEVVDSLVATGKVWE